MVDIFDLSEYGPAFYWAGDWDADAFPRLQRGRSYVLRHDGAFYVVKLNTDGEPLPAVFNESDFARVPDDNVATVMVRPEWKPRANYTVAYDENYPGTEGLSPPVTNAQGVRDEYLYVPGGPSEYQRFTDMVQMAFVDFPVPDISTALEKFDPDTGGVVLGTWPNLDARVPGGKVYVNAAVFARSIIAPEGEDPRLWQAYKPTPLGLGVKYAGDEFSSFNTDLDAFETAYRIPASLVDSGGIVSPAVQRSAGRTDHLSAEIAANLPGGEAFESHVFDVPGANYESLIRNTPDNSAAVWLRPGSVLWEPPPPTLIEKWEAEVGGLRFDLLDREIVIIGERAREVTPDPDPPPRLGGVSLGRSSSGVVRRGG